MVFGLETDKISELMTNFLPCHIPGELEPLSSLVLFNKSAASRLGTGVQDLIHNLINEHRLFFPILRAHIALQIETDQYPEALVPNVFKVTCGGQNILT